MTVSRLQSPSSGEEIVNNQNSLPLGHGISLDLKLRTSVLQVVADLGAVARQFALLADLRVEYKYNVSIELIVVTDG